MSASSYLATIVSRTTGEIAPSGLDPFVRSTSPIADHDQRLMAKDISATTLGAIDAPEAVTDSPVVRAEGPPARPHRAPQSGRVGDATSPIPPLRPSPGLVASPTISEEQRTESTVVFSPPSPTPDPVAPSTAPHESPTLEAPRRAEVVVDRADPIEERVVEEPSRFARPMAIEPARSRRRPSGDTLDRSASTHEPSTIERSLAPTEPTSLLNEAPVVRGSTFRLEPRRRTEQPARADSAPEPSEEVSILTPRARPERVVEAPRAVSSVLRARRGAAESARESAQQQPQQKIVIDRINVEVTPPTPTTTAPAAPLTAEAASVIGPIRPTFRSNLRFGLRRR